MRGSAAGSNEQLAMREAAGSGKRVAGSKIKESLAYSHLPSASSPGGAL